MKLYSVAGACVLCAAAFSGQGKTLPSSGWSPSKVSALSVAKLADDSIRNLSHTNCEYGFVVKDTKYVKSGSFRGTWAVKTPRKFEVHATIFGSSERSAMTEGILRADGTSFSLLNGSWSPAKPLAAKKIVLGNIVEKWPTVATMAMTAPLGSKESPFQTLVKQAQLDPSLVVATAERSMLSKGVKWMNRRITISRKKSFLKKKGDLFYEIVFSNKSNLPVSMTMTIKKPSAYQGEYAWAGRWNQNKNQPFPDKQFAMPADSLVKKKGSKR